MATGGGATKSATGAQAVADRGSREAERWRLRVVRPGLICREPDALVGYFCVGRRVAYLNAACDAVWMQERERQEET